MAIVTQPLGSAEARGSVGGLTYNTWRGKRTVKTRSGPTAEPSEKMLEMIGYAQLANAEWKALTDEQRAAWRDWAAIQREPHWTGQDKRLTGHNWFVRLFVRQTLIFETPADTPPNYTIPHHLVLTALADVAGTLGLFWSYVPWADDADYYVQIYLTAPLSAGRNATLHDAQRNTEVTYTGGSAGLIPTAPGTFTAFARLLHVTGLASSWQSIRTTIPPP